MGVTLGTTPTGSAWVTKALNPASPIAVSGIPDAGVASRVIKHYERTITVTLPASTQNWNLDCMLNANPWIPASILKVDPGISAHFDPVINTQLGSIPGQVRAFLYENTEAYRLLYGSCTAIMDATSITNSGLVAATQYTNVPIIGTLITTVSDPGLVRQAAIWPDAPRSYDQLIQMPGTYVGVAKEGVYLPLRVDPELQWVNTNDQREHINNDDAIALGWSLPGTSSTGYPQANSKSWPFGQPSSYVDANGAIVPSMQFANTQRTCGHIAFRNLHKDAAIRITYRLGFEFLVAPGTTYSPDMRTPPPYDPLALEAYKAISLRLNLAYPAAYNDWQKIVKVIAEVAKVVLPSLPGGQLLKQAVPLAERGAMALGKTIANAVARGQAKKKAVKKKPPVKSSRPLTVVRRKPGK